MDTSMQILLGLGAATALWLLMASGKERFIDGAPYTPLLAPGDFISPSGGDARDFLPVEDSHGDAYSAYA